MVSFMPQLLQSKGKSLWYTLKTRLGWLQSCSKTHIENTDTSCPSQYQTNISQLSSTQPNHYTNYTTLSQLTASSVRHVKCFLCEGIIEPWLKLEADVSQIRAKVLPRDMTCLHCVPQTELLDFLNFHNGLPHLAVLTFLVRAATKLSAWQRCKKNALCVVPSRCIRVTCSPFRAIRKLLRSAISIRTDRHRF